MAEITPATGSYSYGSTSELSTSTTIETNSSLANTGQSMTFLMIVALALIVLGIGLTAGTILRHKHTAR